MRSRLFIALAVSLGVASSHLTAAEAPAGRYQLAVYQPGVLGQSLVLLGYCHRRYMAARYCAGPATGRIFGNKAHVVRA